MGTLPALLGSAALSLIAAVWLPAAVAQDAAPGWQGPLDPVPVSGTRVLSNGDLLRWNGASLDRLAADGSLIQNFATFDPAVFTGAFGVAPDESYAIFGESSFGDMFRLDLDTGNITFLVTLLWNFDLDFSPSGDVFVSAASDGIGTNRIHRVDPLTGASELKVVLSGPAGPLAFDLFGDLYYITQSGSFPTPLGSLSILRWSGFQLDAPVLLTASDAFVVLTGLDGGSGLTLDPNSNQLYFGETNFSPGYLSKIRRVGFSQAASPVLYEGPPGAFLSVGQFLPSTGPAVFAGFQPESGGSLRFSYNDFATVSARRVLTPARPTAAFSGPGTTGAGVVTLELNGGQPGGLAWLAYATPADVLPVEQALFFDPLVPSFAGISPIALQFFPALFQVDGNGSVALPFFNDGSLLGVLAAQWLVLDGAGNLRGTSTTAVL